MINEVNCTASAALVVCGVAIWTFVGWRVICAHIANERHAHIYRADVVHEHRHVVRGAPVFVTHTT